MKNRYSEEELFRSAPVGRAIAALALPTVLSQIITVIYNMADTYFIGQLGDPDQVAAATVAMPLFMCMTALANLFGIGGASLISRSLGAGDRDKAGRCSAFCLWTALALALLYGFAVLACKDWLLFLLGANAGTWQYASDYLLWTVTVGAVPTVLNPMLAHLVRAEGHARQASVGVAFGGVLNMVLDPLFIFALDLEIVGAGIATLLSNSIAVLYYFVFLYRIRRTSALHLSPRYYSLAEHIPQEIVTVGLPSFLISMMASISNTVLNHIIAGYSNEAVAGMGIAKRVGMLAFATAQGMTQGALPLIGFNFSSGDRARMMEIIRKLFVICLTVALAAMALLYFGAAPVSRCFIDDAQTVEHGRMFLQVISTAAPATTLTFLGLVIFQATGKKLPPIFLSILRKGTLDVGLMLLFDRSFGIQGIAWATPVTEYTCLLTAALLVVPYLRRLCRESGLTLRRRAK